MIISLWKMIHTKVTIEVSRFYNFLKLRDQIVTYVSPARAVHNQGLYLLVSTAISNRCTLLIYFKLCAAVWHGLSPTSIPTGYRYRVPVPVPGTGYRVHSYSGTGCLKKYLTIWKRVSRNLEPVSQFGIKLRDQNENFRYKSDVTAVHNLTYGTI